MIAIDLGTSSVKVLLVTPNGEVIGRGSQPYPVSRPLPGCAEQDPDMWWSATRQAVAQSISTSPGVTIEAIGLSGQMHGTVLLGAGTRPLRPAIIWEDTRSGAQAGEIEQRIGRRLFIETTGSAPASGFQAASLLWIQQYQPDLWKQIRHVLLPKDYIRFKLSGEFVTEPSDASGTVLFDVHRRQWSNVVLDALQIDPAQLPEIVPSDTESATLSPPAALSLGLPPRIPIAGGAGDAPAAALASSGVNSRTLQLTISSGSQAIITTNAVKPDPHGRIHSWCHCLAPRTGAGWYMMAATMASGLAMRWLSENILCMPAGDFDQIEHWSSEIGPGADGLVFVPYIAGERTPHMDPHARGMFLGLTATHDRRHLTRAVMEGSVFALYEAYAVLASLSPAPPERIVLAGGGARSAVWTQIIADMFELPVYRNQEPDGSAMGAALLAGASVGWFEAQAGASAWLRLANPITPRPAASVTYRALAEVFRKAYPKHRDDFRLLERVP